MHYKSRIATCLVVDEDDNGKFRPERFNAMGFIDIHSNAPSSRPMPPFNGNYMARICMQACMETYISNGSLL